MMCAWNRMRMKIWKSFFPGKISVQYTLLSYFDIACCVFIRQAEPTECALSVIIMERDVYFSVHPYLHPATFVLICGMYKHVYAQRSKQRHEIFLCDMSNLNEKGKRVKIRQEQSTTSQPRISLLRRVSFCFLVMLMLSLSYWKAFFYVDITKVGKGSLCWKLSCERSECGYLYESTEEQIQPGKITSVKMVRMTRRE